MTLPRVLPVPFHRMKQVLPRAWPYLEHAMLRSKGWTRDELAGRLMGSQSLLWIVIAGPYMLGAVVTELRGQAVYIALLGGSRFASWSHEIAEIERYAVAMGKNQVLISGRKGWRRVLARYGYRMVANGDLVKEVS